MKLPGFSLALVFLVHLAPLRVAGQASGNPGPAGEAKVSDKQLADEEQAKQEKLRQIKWSITVDVEMVQMPQKRALELLPVLRSGDPKKVEAAVAQIQQLISQGEATLIGWPMVTAPDGQRAVAEAIVEERYPTEFDPPQPPENAVGSVTPKPIFTLTPTSFETRNTGTTLEVEPLMLADRKHILLNFAPQRVELAAMKDFNRGRTKEGAEVHIDQPIFHTFKVTGNQIVTSGEPALIAVHLLPDKDHPVELDIIRAVATKID